MKWILIILPLVVLIGALAILAELLKRLNRVTTERVPQESIPYEAAGPLLSEAELSFLGPLRIAAERAFGPDIHVAVQVPLCTLLRVRRGLSQSERQTAWNRIDRKRVDYVITTMDLQPLIVVELDDRSHRRGDRQVRDSFVDEALDAAGIPMLHELCRQAYSPGELAERLMKAGQPNGAGPKRISSGESPSASSAAPARPAAASPR